MAKEVHVEGYEALQKQVDVHKGHPIFVLFSGSVGPDGQSWCPDCVIADPVIKESLHAAPKDAVVIHCGVGDRPFWKDQKNVFRTKLRINCVPTLIKWGEQKRLEDADCAKKDLVVMLFEDK